MLFNRSYRISIDIGTTRKVYKQTLPGEDALKIDFEIDMSVNRTFSKATISLTGLNMFDLSSIATNRNKAGVMNKSNVLLELGYNGMLSEVVKGNISECQANTATVDKVIRMEILTGYNANMQEKVTSKRNATFRDACVIAASNNGLRLDYDSSIPNLEIGDYSYKGKPAQQIQELRTYNPEVTIAVRNTVLQVRSKEPKGVKQFDIDSNNGMIGDIEITNYGLNVRTLLNPSLQINDFVNLKSKRLPQVNSNYRIMELKHRGTNRGDLWESYLILRKV